MKERSGSPPESDERRRDLKNMAETSGGMILADGSFWRGNDRRERPGEGVQPEKRPARKPKGLLEKKRSPSLYFG